MTDASIVRKLYEEYCVDEVGDNEVLSSHWRKFTARADVRMDGDRVVGLTGVGFGDVERMSLQARVLQAMTIRSYVLHLERGPQIGKLIGPAKRLAKRMGVVWSYDLFRQACTFDLVSTRLDGRRPLRVLSIGDGYGFLSALIREMVPDARVCMVDIGRTLLFQAHYVQKAHPDAVHVLATGPMDQDTADSADFVYVPAEHLGLLDGLCFDLATNVNSMQEMTPEIVAAYFDFMRKHMTPGSLFYCCNREEKVLPGGEVLRIREFPWDAQDTVYVDELCPWLSYYPSRHAGASGPKVLGVRVPFMTYMDAKVIHKLVTLRLDDDGARAKGALQQPRFDKVSAHE